MGVNFKKISKKSYIVIFLLVSSFVLTRIFDYSSLAAVTPPAFPSCNPKIFETNGDWSHYDFGSHEILGIGRREGRDDVYFLTSGNFLQCFCPVEGADGIQTNFWNVQRQGLSDEEIQGFTAQGWTKVVGRDWNIFDETYLAKNESFSCVQETPTVTVTPMPSVTLTPTLTPTPSLTPTPTVTLTPGPEPESPRCVGLSASPSEGSAPLTVKFTGSGFDKNGPILEYEFDFGDASGGQPQIWKQKESEASHRYENAGTFIASLRVKDQGGTWRDGNNDCKKTITVLSGPRVLAATTPEELPSAGTFAVSFLGLVPVGYYLYRRFKIEE